MQVIKKLILTLGLVLLSLTAAAQDFPKPTGYINDFANIISPEISTQLSNIIRQFDKLTTNEIAVVTIPTLDNIPIEDYTVKLFENWGIGKKETDNGILLLVVPNDRQVRIEVGYDLEKYINDALAGRIIREVMVPHFRSSNYSLGILNGVIEITNQIAKKSQIEFDPITAGEVTQDVYRLQETESATTTLIGKIIKVIVIIFIILLFIKNPWLALLVLSNISGGRGGSFRGGFGGGFSGFGGGSSGGGGATGRW
jgi:uncharacterized protein